MFGFRRVCSLATGVSFERECVLPFLDEDLPPEDSCVLIFVLFFANRMAAAPPLSPATLDTHTPFFARAFVFSREK